MNVPPEEAAGILAIHVSEPGCCVMRYIRVTAFQEMPCRPRPCHDDAGETRDRASRGVRPPRP
jgi:hypothetical protein